MEVTILIKTMIRPKSVVRLIKSLLIYYPDNKILIADDGRPSSKNEVLSNFPNANIDYYELPEDSGLSYGRNFLLNKVHTPYFLLCDDDFVIDHTLNLEELICVMEKEQLDILGGYVRNYKIVKSFKDRIIILGQKLLRYELCTNYIGTLKLKDNILVCNYKRKEYPDFVITDICQNFFLARTDSVQRINGWDNDLKLQEHTEFFFRAKLHGLKVGFTNKMSVKHFPEHSKNYSIQRKRDFTALFLKKHNLQKVYSYYDDKTPNTVEYFDSKGDFVSEIIEYEGGE